MCDWPIQHRPPSPVFRRLSQKTSARGRNGTGGRHVDICDHMGQCGIPPFPCSHSLVWCPSEDEFFSDRWIEHWTCNPRLWVQILAPVGIVHDWGETLEQGTEPLTAPRAPQRRLPTAPSVCALGWVKCREHISLLVILCIIMYVTNKKIINTNTKIKVFDHQDHRTTCPSRMQWMLHAKTWQLNTARGG